MLYKLFHLSKAGFILDMVLFYTRCPKIGHYWFFTEVQFFGLRLYFLCNILCTSCIKYDLPLFTLWWLFSCFSLFLRLRHWGGSQVQCSLYLRWEQTEESATFDTNRKITGPFHNCQTAIRWNIIVNEACINECIQIVSLHWHNTIQP